MGPIRSLKIAAFVVLSWLAVACSGRPEVVSTGGKPQDETAGSGGSDDTQLNGGSGQPALETDGGSTCKKTCDNDECGPVADGCGSIVKCGGCVAPATCGGSGVPSHCGEPATSQGTCVPKTCATLGATCGLEADGCGAVLNCWGTDSITVGSKQHCSDPAAACVEGACKTLSSCTALTCADYPDATGLCGPVSDGCGGTLDCGFACPSGAVCGLLQAGKCDTASCQPLNCEAALAGKPPGYCGYLADGCGSQVANCATKCTGSDTCGGGGTPDACGHGTVACVPKTLPACGQTCGSISDGCSGTLDCGGCTAPETCGGGGVASQCGAPVCQPRTCSSVGANCGSMPDGCGGTLACGGCTNTQVCNANQCLDVVCKPKTAAEVCTGLCGAQSDGCSGTVDCGGCTLPNLCGGGGTPSVCGVPACVPLTCQAAGASCGPIGDGCGNIIPSCGACTGQDICGGGGTPSVCGHPTNGTPCTGLCQNQAICPVGQETRLSGVVYAPNGTEPLYNALVYVPNAPLPAIFTGPSCERCQDEDLGSPIAAALTGADGAFVLKNVPAGVSFPLVVKMGKWRRVVTVSSIPKCTNLDLAVDQTRLPRNVSDASASNVPYINIPKTAMVTGDVDALECVLRKIGVSDSEFTLPSGTGRIHMYRANGGNMGCSATNKNGSCKTFISAPLSSLFTGTTVDKYDLGIFGCEGGANEHNTYDAPLRSWAERGGRVFASHYSYTYLHDNGNFAATAVWNGPYRVNDPISTGIIDTGFTKGNAFNSWLGNVNAWSPVYGSGYIQIQDPRDYVQSVSGASERFVYTDSTAQVSGTLIDKQTAIQQYAFNTPVGADTNNVCGRVLYSAFHVAGISGAGSKIFPSYCSTGPLTPQEKVLEFMLFDLSACVSVGSPPPPATCTPKTCTSLGANCGPVADGCGGILSCGNCAAPASCGGGGVANQCGSNCKQTSCGAKGANCGTIADGCGSTILCGTCTSPAACGGGGTSNVCGVPQCQPRSCTSANAECGPIADGCGSTINCGSCASGSACGGGGAPNVCGAGSCTPLSCQSVGANCGLIGDGCGGTISCGTCQSNSVCGVGGPNLCGTVCSPRTCAQGGASCGFIGDGCGGVLNCGTCASPLICGGGGVASTCGGSCTPRTCAQAGAACGAITDGCGGILQCGACPTGNSCGGSGAANQCGSGTCMARTCAAAGASCGSVGDGCGGILSCGDCVSPQSCGGAGVPNQCGKGSGGCVPLTCAQQNANCGPVADGCGSLLDCGVCLLGACGGAGVPSKCGAVM